MPDARQGALLLRLLPIAAARQPDLGLGETHVQHIHLHEAGLPPVAVYLRAVSDDGEVEGQRS